MKIENGQKTRRRLGVVVAHLVQINRISNPNRIYVGQRLVYYSYNHI